MLKMKETLRSQTDMRRYFGANVRNKNANDSNGITK